MASMLDFSHIAGFRFYQRKCMDESCEKCGLYNIMMMRSISRDLPELTANGKKKRKKNLIGLPTGAIVLSVSGAAVKKSSRKKGVIEPSNVQLLVVEPARGPDLGRYNLSSRTYECRHKEIYMQMRIFFI
jgi:hypothetical protein